MNILASKTLKISAFLIGILVWLFFSNSCNIATPKNQTLPSIEIHFDSLNFNGKVTLSRMSPNKIILMDSAISKEGETIRFEIQAVQSPDIYVLRFSNNQAITLILDRDNSLKIRLLGEPINMNYELHGSADSKNMQEINDLVNMHIRIFESYYGNYRSADKNQNVDSLRIFTDSMLQQNQIELYNGLRSTISEKAGSLAALVGLYSQFGNHKILDMELDYDLFKQVSDSLLKNYPQNTHAISLEETITQIQIKKETLEKRESLLDEGNIFPDLNLFSLNNAHYDLKTNSSEIKIVYVWKASQKGFWDTNPVLKNIYKNHARKKLDVIGISFEKDKLQWANYCRMEGLNWVNLIADHSTEILINPSGVYPRIYILDKDFKIIAKDPSPEQIESYIK